MGILGEIVKDVAEAAAVDKVNDLMNKHDEKLKAKNPSDFHLHITQNGNLLKDAYYAIDDSDKKKYRIKGEMISRQQNYHIYDMKGNEVGTVTEKPVGYKVPRSVKPKPKIFIIENNNIEVGEFKYGFQSTKKSLGIEFNDWEFSSNIWGTHIKVKKGAEEIMNIHELMQGNAKRYTINYPNPSNELECLAMLVALIAASRAQ